MADALSYPRHQLLEVMVRIGGRAGPQPEMIGTRKLRSCHSPSWFHPDGSVDKMNRWDTVDRRLNG